MSLTVNWRLVFFFSIGLRFLFALSNSYIHPDEHFQSFEVMAGPILGYSVHTPWEFSAAAPARSLGPLYLMYAPVMYLVKWSGLHAQINPIHVWYLVRLEIMVVGWVVSDWCLYRMLPTKQERIKAIFFTSTSYVTLAHQSHGFSNSIETVLVVLSVYVIDDLRFTLEESKKRQQPAQTDLGKLFTLGCVVSIGIFNRVTFPVFLVVPSWFLLKYCWSKKLSLIVIALGFSITTVAFVVVDTVSFANVSLKALASQPFDISNFVITPLNNLLYNANYDNLSQHGIHSHFNHLLVNLPQILGPAGLVMLFPRFKNRYWQTTPFLSAMSGIAILSLVPHQEPRFLAPVVPLLCSCFDVAAFSSSPEQKSTKGEKESSGSSGLGTFLLNSWYLFNLVMVILMGLLHQGGVVPALDHFHESIYKQPQQQVQHVQIWWRTYSPPTWLLGDSNNSTQVISLSDEKSDFTLDQSKSNFVLDTMGMDFDKLTDVIGNVRNPEHPDVISSILSRLRSVTEPPKNKKIQLIAPVSSFNINFGNHTDLQFKQVWNYNYHLDLDHLDINNRESFRPGLGIYELM